MTPDYYRRQIESAQREIARLQREKSSEAGKLASLSKKIADASRAANRSSSVSTATTKLRDIERYQGDKAAVEKHISDLERRIGQQQSKVHDAGSGLAKAEQYLARSRDRQTETFVTQTTKSLKEIDGTLASHATTLRKLTSLPERIVVLFLAANPIDQQQLRLDEEARAIAEMIRKAKHRDAVELRSCWAVRPMDVLQAINECKPTVVHFSGHGSTADEIVFQDDAGNAKLVTRDAIVQLMKASSGDIRLVFFNTCFSRNQAAAVVEHVEAAIGMKTAIGDVAARVFASQFYSAIGFGLSISQAFEQARALVMMEGLPEDQTPELFVHAGEDATAIVLVRPPSDDAVEQGATG